MTKFHKSPSNSIFFLKFLSFGDLFVLAFLLFEVTLERTIFLVSGFLSGVSGNFGVVGGFEICKFWIWCWICECLEVGMEDGETRVASDNDEESISYYLSYRPTNLAAFLKNHQKPIKSLSIPTSKITLSIRFLTPKLEQINDNWWIKKKKREMKYN